MKKHITFLLTLFLCSMLFAQQPGSHRDGSKKSHCEPPKIEEMVSDLSSIQKKRLETVMQNSHKQLDKLQAELSNVRKQIRALLKSEGDQSDKLFPLFEREGYLQTEISKEMYKCRVQIDNILTKDQLKEFKARCESNRRQHKADPKR